MMDDFVQLNVGGILYSVAKGDIQKFPESFFACLLKKEWSAENHAPINIVRDGIIFRLVNGYLVSGSLPRTKTGGPSLDPDIIKRLQEEADFYGLADLVLECKHYHKARVEVDLPNYLLIQKFIDKLEGFVGGPHELGVEYESELVNALKPLSVGFCLVGSLDKRDYTFTERIYNESTCGNLNIPEFHASFSGATEIDATQLLQKGVNSVGNRPCIGKFAPNLNLTVRSSKLVILQEGCSQELGPVLQAVRKEGHIGTLVVILNSTYTGGELEVTHGGRTEVVTGPYSWVAMYGDCLHKINPVTSGTRVSLIYDIYGSKKKEISQKRSKEDCDYGVRSMWSNHYVTKYHPNRYSGQKFGCLGLGDGEKEHLSKALSLEVAASGRDGVLIALQHLYPDYQNVIDVIPSAFQDGDKILYELLTGPTTETDSANNLNPRTTADRNQYDVNFVTVMLYRCQYERREEDDTTRCMIFNAKAVARELDLCDGDNSEDGDGDCTDDNKSDHSSSDSVESGADCAAEGEEYVTEDNQNDALEELGEDDEKSSEQEEEILSVKNAQRKRTKVLIPYPLDVEGLLDYKQENWKSCQPEQLVFVATCLQVRKKL